jgi:hypothetical protein
MILFEEILKTHFDPFSLIADENITGTQILMQLSMTLVKYRCLNKFT